MTTPKRFRLVLYTLPIFFFHLFSGLQSLSAQSSFISTASYGYHDLTSEEQDNYSKISGNSALSSFKFIELADFLSSTANGELTINFPELECSSVTYLARYVKYTDANNYAWSGYLNAELGSCNKGNFVLANINGQITGMFNIEDNHYFIHDIDNGKYVLTTLLNLEGETRTCAHDTEAISEPDEPSFVPEENPEHRTRACRTKIIVFYDPDIDYVAAGFPATTQEDFQNVVEFQMLLLDIISSGSDIRNVRYDLVAVKPLPETVEPIIQSFTYVSNFRNSALVQQQKVAHQADIAVLLTAGDTPNAFGIVYELLPSNPENAMALVRLSHEAIRRWTFAHEISHLYGAGHDETSEPPLQPYSRARKFGDGIPLMDAFYTTDARAPSDDQVLFPRVMHFSNPDVRFFFWRTGTDLRNNARMIRENSCEVSNLIGPIELPVNVGLEAPYSACACQPVTVQFVGDPSTTYTNFNWFRSLNGHDFGMAFSNQPDEEEVELPCVLNRKVWIRLIVEDVMGNSYTYETSIISTNEDANGDPCELRKLYDQDDVESNFTFLYPNPTTDFLNIKDEHVIEGNTNWRIVTLSGSIVLFGKNTKKDLDKNKLIINISELPAGVYMLILENENQTKELKFVKQ